MDLMLYKTYSFSFRSHLYVIEFNGFIITAIVLTTKLLVAQYVHIYYFQKKKNRNTVHPHKKNKGLNWLMYGQLIKTNGSSKFLICRPMQIEKKKIFLHPINTNLSFYFKF